nr:AIF_HP1_G0030790.mRNA.1.CDS.1 [Saccharomyces cerevisiae]
MLGRAVYPSNLQLGAGVEKIVEWMSRPMFRKAMRNLCQILLSLKLPAHGIDQKLHFCPTNE